MDDLIFWGVAWIIGMNVVILWKVYNIEAKLKALQNIIDNIKDKTYDSRFALEVFFTDKYKKNISKYHDECNEKLRIKMKAKEYGLHYADPRTEDRIDGVAGAPDIDAQSADKYVYIVPVNKETGLYSRWVVAPCGNIWYKLGEDYYKELK